MSLVALALTAVVLVSACGKKESKNSNEIEFFTQKPETVDIVKEIAKDFEKENEDIKVKVVYVPDPLNVLKTRISSDSTPDIINCYPMTKEFSEWVKGGVFEDLTGKDFLKNLKPGVAEEYAVDGKIYNAPLNTNAWGFFYNETEFKKLGLEAPKTWAEFEQVVKDIKAQGQTPFALALSQADAWSLNGYGQLAWAQAAGGFDQAQDMLRFSEKGAISSSSTAFQDVVSQLDLLRGNGQNNSNGATYNDSVVAFATGKALILPQGIWALPAIQQQNPDFEIKSFAFPGKTEADMRTIGGPDMGISISSKSKNKEAAEKFVAYFSSPEIFQKYYDVDGEPTSIEGVETAGKFPETEGITNLSFTDQSILWLHSEWESESDFNVLTVDYVRDGSADDMANKLNVYFDSMK